MEDRQHPAAAQYPYGWSPGVKEYSHKLLDKAMDAIEATEILVDNEKFDIGAGRA